MRVRTYTQAFMSKVEKLPCGCWLWRGAINDSGYGTFSYRRRSYLAHRWAYRYIAGKRLSPELHHTCTGLSRIMRRRCVNPDHVEPVESLKHPDKPSVVNLTKESCPAGHPYSGKNLYVDRSGHRHCRLCRRVSAIEDYRRNREERRKLQKKYYAKNAVAILAKRKKRRRELKGKP